MRWIKKIVQIGGSIGIIFPTDLLKYLEAENGDDFIITIEEDEKGKFLKLQKNLVQDDN